MMPSISLRCGALKRLRGCAAGREEPTRQHGRGGEHARLRAQNVTSSGISPSLLSVTAAWSGGLVITMSSAFTQPGEPTGKRVLARAASSRAVLTSPRDEGGLRGGEIGLREIALAAIGHGELVYRRPALPARATARCAAWRPLRRHFRLLSVAISAWPSMIWISAGLGASATAWRSGAIASAGRPLSSSAWPLSS